MYFGIDVLEREQFRQLAGQRVALFTNLAAVNRDMVPTYRIFNECDQFELVCFFSPEHGLNGMVADGIAVDSTADSVTGLPVYSLYGDQQAPTTAMLQDVDTVVCDIQDIGVRYYTFLWTLTHILEVCGNHHTAVVVLDRPNPLGEHIDGGGLDAALGSLVGRFSIPIQHGMTIGELATMINATWNPTPAEVDIIRCEGWQRNTPWSATGRPFVPPSPNMPHLSTAQHYPGACLIEGTSLSEGRGTALPFEVVGAPFIDAFALAATLNAQSIAGAQARPHVFQPTSSKFKGQPCAGIQLYITDLQQFRPLPAWLQVLGTIRQMYPQQFEWLAPHNGQQHFDRLIGDTTTRSLIDEGATLDTIVADWEAFHAAFREQRQPFLLYGVA